MSHKKLDKGKNWIGYPKGPEMFKLINVVQEGWNMDILSVIQNWAKIVMISSGLSDTEKNLWYF